MDMHTLLIRPLITEKSMKESEKGKFTFVVHMEVDKKNIRKVIEDKFNVHVLQVSTRIRKGSAVRFGPKKLLVKKASQKYATVQLKAGEKIDLFDLKGNS